MNRMSSYSEHPVTPIPRMEREEADRLVSRFVWRRRAERAGLFVAAAAGIGAVVVLASGNGPEVAETLRSAFVTEAPATSAGIAAQDPVVDDEAPYAAAIDRDEVEPVRGFDTPEIEPALGVDEAPAEAAPLGAVEEEQDVAPARAANVDAVRRGDALLAQDRAWDALLSFERAAERGDRATEAYVGMGRAYLALDKPQAAQVQFRRALMESPEHPPAVFNLGEALRAANDNGAALVEYRRYLAIAPNGRHASDALEAIQLLEATPN